MDVVDTAAKFFFYRDVEIDKYVYEKNGERDICI